MTPKAERVSGRDSSRLPPPPASAAHPSRGGHVAVDRRRHWSAAIARINQSLKVKAKSAISASRSYLRGRRAK
jgi:hypothetical protein